MLSLYPSSEDPYTIEIWLDEPLEALSPVLLELYLDFDQQLFTLGESSTGPAGLFAGSNLFASLTEPLRDQVRVTFTGGTIARLASGHIGSVQFTPLTTSGASMQVSFDLDQYQVAPVYILDYVSFGQGHPSTPLSIP
jgi:hypothetical protein